MKIVNRKAHYQYQILEKIEAGIVLTGGEIKSIRAGRANLTESFARIKDGEVYLVNAHIFPWTESPKLTNTRRQRKLLLHKKQILGWLGKIAGSKLTIVPLAIYLKGNLAKVELALAKSKKKFDKRAALRQRTLEREIAREIRGEKF